MKIVAAIHTASPMIEPTKTLFKEHLPDVRLINIADDSLIQDVIKAGCVPPAVAKRLISYYYAAVDAGADLIFNTCSSVGEIADIAKLFLSVPIVRIDDAMTAKAVETSDSVGVLATLPTTLGPTVRLVNKQAEVIGKKVSVVEGLAEGAFEALIGGDAMEHDGLILETARRVAKQVDTLVLAQGSMAKMEETLANETGKLVLSSPRLGVLSVKSRLEKMRL